MPPNSEDHMFLRREDLQIILTIPSQLEAVHAAQQAMMDSIKTLSESRAVTERDVKALMAKTFGNSRPGLDERMLRMEQAMTNLAKAQAECPARLAATVTGRRERLLTGLSVLMAVLTGASVLLSFRAVSLERTVRDAAFRVPEATQ